MKGVNVTIRIRINVETVEISLSQKRDDFGKHTKPSQMKELMRAIKSLKAQQMWVFRIKETNNKSWDRPTMFHINEKQKTHTQQQPFLPSNLKKFYQKRMVSLICLVWSPAYHSKLKQLNEVIKDIIV